MRIVFIGSAPLACSCLQAVLPNDRYTVAAVVTQPDRPKGRHLKPAPCAVKALAAEAGLPALTPARVNAPEPVGKVAAFSPDLIVVVAYGQILKRALLRLAPLGTVNIHASLLPRYRGAAPIQWAIANGEKTTGATSMFMNERMDAGDIIFQEPMPIQFDDTAGSLHDRMGTLAGSVLLKTLDALQAGTAPRVSQNEEDVIFAPKLTKADGKIDWTRDAVDIYNRIRGFNPWPGACCICPRRKTVALKVLKAGAEGLPPGVAGEGPPGEIVELGREGPLVRAGKAGIRLLEVQPAGGKVMDGAAYLCGHRLELGERFE